MRCKSDAVMDPVTLLFWDSTSSIFIFFAQNWVWGNHLLLEIPWCDQVWWKKANLPGLDQQRDNFGNRKLLVSWLDWYQGYTHVSKKMTESNNFQTFQTFQVYFHRYVSLCVNPYVLIKKKTVLRWTSEDIFKGSLTKRFDKQMIRCCFC